MGLVDTGNTVPGSAAISVALAKELGVKIVPSQQDMDRLSNPQISTFVDTRKPRNGLGSLNMIWIRPLLLLRLAKRGLCYPLCLSTL